MEMKNVFLVFVLIVLVTKHGECSCSSCSCPDILSLTTQPQNVLYTESVGCNRNATCLMDYDTAIKSNWADTEIPTIPEANTEHPLYISTYDVYPVDSFPEETIDIFSYFGIICENNTWFATKYPNGLAYTPISGESLAAYTGKKIEYNGKKTKINDFKCVRV